MAFFGPAESTDRADIIFISPCTMARLAPWLERRMMLQLADVLKAMGPNASIVFAAWIFMGFLQQRYDNAIDRFRASVGDFRSNDHADERSENLRDQIAIYRRRCRLMGWSTLVGLVAAILLIASLIFGALDVIMPNHTIIAVAGTAAALLGFALVIVAAAIVIAEGRIVSSQMDKEMLDVPELAPAASKATSGKTPR